jgi:hypothetical protein
MRASAAAAARRFAPRAKIEMLCRYEGEMGEGRSRGEDVFDRFVTNGQLRVR